jgi:hypothetical protein
MKLLTSLLLAVALVIGRVPVAGAVAEWCEDDPLVTIVTRAGNRVDVHVTNYGQGAQFLPAVKRATVFVEEVDSSHSGKVTEVKIHVVVPHHLGQRFATRAVVSTGPSGTGTLLAVAEGRSGDTMQLEFKLDVP